MTFEPENNGKTDIPFRKRNETTMRANTDKRDTSAFDVEKLQQAIMSLTNEVVILKIMGKVLRIEEILKPHTDHIHHQIRGK